MLPVLKANCFKCHDATQADGPSCGSTSAPGRCRAASPASRRSSPGKAAESELFRRITTSNEDEVMPPKASRCRRSRSPRSRRGSTPGRSGPTRWPTRPPRSTGRSSRRSGRPCPPPATRPVRNPIDRFVLRPARDAKGLTPSPEADQRHAAPPAVPRPDRPAADAGGGRRVPRRHVAGRLREAGRAAAGVARTTASGGAGTGSTPPATPTATATRRTSRGSSGSTATGSSTPSTATCPTTGSSSSRSPATCCRTRRRTSSSPPGSCATR